MALQKEPHVRNVALERPLGTNRPDVSAEINGVSANTARNTLALLDTLKTEMPEIWGEAQVVGRWVWLEFNVPPVQEIRANLKKLGFHWNGQRKCWQHPCGAPRPRLNGDL